MFTSDSAPLSDAQGTTADEDAVIIARGRINNANKVFKRRGCKILPNTERGLRILRWYLDHVWLASPEKWRIVRVRRACDRLAPWLTRDKRAEMIERTKTSNKRWTHDQSAIVLELSLAENWEHDGGLRFLGACDDDNRERRDERKREKGKARARKWRAEHGTGRSRGRPAGLDDETEKATRKRKQSAESSRRHRAANSTGAKRGKPSLQLSDEAKAIRRKAQQAERARRYRASRNNACSENASRSLSKNIGSVTDFSVMDLSVTPLTNVIYLSAKSISISKATTIPIDIRKAA